MTVSGRWAPCAAARAVAAGSPMATESPPGDRNLSRGIGAWRHRSALRDVWALRRRVRRQEEAAALLKAALGPGLRASEVCALTPADIESDRMMIRVVQGKGRKDRHVMPSPAFLRRAPDSPHTSRRCAAPTGWCTAPAAPQCA